MILTVSDPLAIIGIDSVWKSNVVGLLGAGEYSAA
jgi:hypothetical protein